MLGVAQCRFVLAQPRETRAGRGGFKRQTLAQRARKNRFAATLSGAQQLVEMSDAGAGEKRGPGTVGGVAFRATRQRPDCWESLRIWWIVTA